MNAPVLVPPVIPAHPQLTYDHWLMEYPLRSFLDLGAYPEAPGSARGHVRNVLAEWRLGIYADAAALVVSELVTNSLAATRARPWEGGLPPVRLWLLGGAGSDGTGEVMTLIWDAVPAGPAPRPAREDDEAGRGLEIVAALCARWDWYLPPALAGGKVTWAIIDKPWRDQPPAG